MLQYEVIFEYLFTHVRTACSRPQRYSGRLGSIESIQLLQSISHAKAAANLINYCVADSPISLNRSMDGFRDPGSQPIDVSTWEIRERGRLKPVNDLKRISGSKFGTTGGSCTTSARIKWQMTHQAWVGYQAPCKHRLQGVHQNREI